VAAAGALLFVFFGASPAGTTASSLEQLRALNATPHNSSKYGSEPCVQSGDGLSVCFTGPQASATSAAGRPLATHTAGFSLRVHTTDAEPTLLDANNLLRNANFTQSDKAGAKLPADWAPYDQGMYTRTTDPLHTRPGGAGTAVLVNNSNGSGVGLDEGRKPGTPCPRRFILNGESLFTKQIH
jgi:hypothetical protein